MLRRGGFSFVAAVALPPPDREGAPTPRSECNGTNSVRVPTGIPSTVKRRIDALRDRAPTRTDGNSGGRPTGCEVVREGGARTGVLQWRTADRAEPTRPPRPNTRNFRPPGMLGDDGSRQ